MKVLSILQYFNVCYWLTNNSFWMRAPKYIELSHPQAYFSNAILALEIRSKCRNSKTTCFQLCCLKINNMNFGLLVQAIPKQNPSEILFSFPPIQSSSSPSLRDFLALSWNVKLSLGGTVSNMLDRLDCYRLKFRAKPLQKQLSSLLKSTWLYFSKFW